MMEKSEILKNMNKQLSFGETPIETVVITPTKDMPFEVFKACHHLAYFMELIERLPDGRVIWDENVTDIVDESLAAIEYEAMQNDWFQVNFELPKPFVDKFADAEIG